MKFSITVAVSLTLAGFSAAASPGRAAVKWIAASTTYQSGKVLETAVRMVIDEGHHTYWVNPGEGGMKTSVVWELPEGWSAGELEQPVPKRFKTGELAGFGYEGTVVFPVRLTAPANFTGDASLKGRVTWLACNEDQCIPGDAEISLNLTAGPPAATGDSELIDAARRLVPVAAPGLVLDVAEIGDDLLLTLKIDGPITCDPATSEVFPATPEAIDAAAEVHFEKASGGDWTATVKKSEYLSGPVSALTLVFTGKGTPAPLLVTWKN
jgi:DsbC/DsbD-like thiol-disulfide interchange protein